MIDQTGLAQVRQLGHCGEESRNFSVDFVAQVVERWWLALIGWLREWLFVMS